MSAGAALSWADGFPAPTGSEHRTDGPYGRVDLEWSTRGPSGTSGALEGADQRPVRVDLRRGRQPRCGTGQDAVHDHPRTSRRALRRQSRPSTTVHDRGFVDSATSKRAAAAKAGAQSTTPLPIAARVSVTSDPYPRSAASLATPRTRSARVSPSASAARKPSRSMALDCNFQRRERHQAQTTGAQNSRHQTTGPAALRRPLRARSRRDLPEQCSAYACPVHA